MKVNANGIAVNVNIEGPSSAPTVVLSHSLLLSIGAWDAVAADLASDYRVVRYDLRGHGETEATTGAYSMGELADDVVALLDALDIDRAHYVGLSIGGGIGQVLASRNPDRVNRLVLAATGPKTPPEGAAQWQARIAEVREGGIDTQIEPFIGRWFTPSADPAVVERTEAMMANTSVDGFIGCCEALTVHDALGALGAITAPTLVLTGSDDPGSTPAIGDLLASKIPGATHTTIPDASHQIALQHPGAFVAAVRAHLAE